MRNDPDPVRLSFLLPEGADIDCALARYEPAYPGCGVHFHAAGLVTMLGPSRDAVFADVEPFLCHLLPGRRTHALHATMVTARDPARGMPSGRDSWTILKTAAQIAFLPTRVAPYDPPPRTPARAPPQLTLLPGGQTE